MPPKSPNQKTGIGIRHVLRAGAIGVLLFVLWSLAPIFIMKMAGVDLSGPPPYEEPAKPVRLDTDGKRINEVDYEISVGYDKAKQQGITSHAECKRMEKVYDGVGCHRYVTQQKKFPPHVHQENWASGKTTEQCRAEVNAYYEAVTRDMRERGEDKVANSRLRRHWMPELEQCQNYDNVRISDIIHKPASRLEEILRKVDEGGTISSQDRVTVLNDRAGVLAFPDGPYKQDYLSKSDYFFDLADGKIQPTPKIVLKMSCAEFQARLDAMAKAEQETIAAQARLKRSDGVVTDGAQWKALNQARIDRMWDSKRHSDAARAAGCSISAR